MSVERSDVPRSAMPAPYPEFACHHSSCPRPASANRKGKRRYTRIRRDAHRCSVRAEPTLAHIRCERAIRVQSMLIRVHLRFPFLFAEASQVLVSAVILLRHRPGAPVSKVCAVRDDRHSMHEDSRRGNTKLTKRCRTCVERIAAIRCFVVFVFPRRLSS